MMLNFRPVDCYTKQPFTDFVPGYVNETIYGDRVESGWSYNVYGSDQNQFALQVSRHRISCIHQDQMMACLRPTNNSQ